jgi:hypothetical protein
MCQLNNIFSCTILIKVVSLLQFLLSFICPVGIWLNKRKLFILNNNSNLKTQDENVNVGYTYFSDVFFVTFYILFLLVLIYCRHKSLIAKSITLWISFPYFLKNKKELQISMQ